MCGRGGGARGVFPCFQCRPCPAAHTAQKAPRAPLASSHRQARRPRTPALPRVPLACQARHSTPRSLRVAASPPRSLAGWPESCPTALLPPAPSPSFSWSSTALPPPPPSAAALPVAPPHGPAALAAPPVCAKKGRRGHDHRQICLQLTTSTRRFCRYHTKHTRASLSTHLAMLLLLGPQTDVIALGRAPVPHPPIQHGPLLPYHRVVLMRRHGHWADGLG